MDNAKKVRLVIYYSIGFFLILLSAFRPVGLDKDSLLFVQHLDDSFSEIDILSKEPTFWILQQLNLILFNKSNITFFAFYAVIAITLKLRIFLRLSQHPFFALYIYITYFYILQDFTQFRSGVAIAMFFWALCDIVKRNTLSFYIKMIAASLFHYSAVLLLFTYIIKPRFKKIDFCLYFLLPLLAFAFYGFNILYELIPLIANYVGGPIQFKVNAYYELMYAGEMLPVNPFSIGFLFLLLIYFYSIYMARYKYRKEYQCFHYKAFVVSVKLMGIGIFFYCSMYFIEAFSNRMIQYLFFPLVIIIPYLIYNTEQKFIVGYVFLLFLCYTFIKLFSNSLNIDVF